MTQSNMVRVDLPKWPIRKKQFLDAGQQIKIHLGKTIVGLMGIAKEKAIEESPRGQRTIGVGDMAGRSVRRVTSKRTRTNKKTGVKKTYVSTREVKRTTFAASWSTTQDVTLNGARGLLVNKAKHAPFVMTPTKPHAIAVKNRKALMFVSDGSVLFRRRVMHPGTKGNPVIQRVWDKHHNTFEHKMLEEVDWLEKEYGKIFSDSDK